MNHEIFSLRLALLLAEAGGCVELENECLVLGVLLLHMRKGTVSEVLTVIAPLAERLAGEEKPLRDW